MLTQDLSSPEQARNFAMQVAPLVSHPQEDLSVEFFRVGMLGVTKTLRDAEGEHVCRLSFEIRTEPDRFDPYLEKLILSHPENDTKLDLLEWSGLGKWGIPATVGRKPFYKTAGSYCTDRWTVSLPPITSFAWLDTFFHEARHGQQFHKGNLIPQAYGLHPENLTKLLSEEEKIPETTMDSFTAFCGNLREKKYLTPKQAAGLLDTARHLRSLLEQQKAEELYGLFDLYYVWKCHYSSETPPGLGDTADSFEVFSYVMILVQKSLERDAVAHSLKTLRRVDRALWTNILRSKFRDDGFVGTIVERNRSDLSTYEAVRWDGIWPNLRLLNFSDFVQPL